MVYSVLGIALASGDPLSGAVLMLAFGLGTLPNLVAMGVLADHAQPFFKHPRFRQAAGALVLAFGIIGMVRAMQPTHDPSFGHAADSKSSVGHVRASH
jgi:sulfite exporter TauE/SafE